MSTPQWLAVAPAGGSISSVKFMFSRCEAGLIAPEGADVEGGRLIMAEESPARQCLGVQRPGCLGLADGGCHCCGLQGIGD